MSTDSRVQKTYGEKIVDAHYSPPGMTAPLAVKDLRLALAEAERAAVPMPADEPSSTTASSRWWLAGGPGWTGRPSAYARPLMRASTTVVEEKETYGRKCRSEIMRRL
jgi:hypothetical protein